MSNEKLASAVEILGGVLGGMTPEAAVGQKQERERQEMIKTNRIPREIHYGAPFADVLGMLLGWGVGFPKGLNEGADSHFCEVTLPPGWRIVPDPKEPMLSFLVDATGRQRARIFYKNSGYDEAIASMSIIPRYSVEDNYHDGAMATGQLVARVMDGGINELHRVELDATNLDRRGRFALLQEAKHEAERWLGARYPRWQTPHEYWGK